MVRVSVCTDQNITLIACIAIEYIYRHSCIYHHVLHFSLLLLDILLVWLALSLFYEPLRVWSAPQNEERLKEMAEGYVATLCLNQPQPVQQSILILGTKQWQAFLGI